MLFWDEKSTILANGGAKNAVQTIFEKRAWFRLARRLFLWFLDTRGTTIIRLSKRWSVATFDFGITILFAVDFWRQKFFGNILGTEVRHYQAKSDRYLMLNTILIGMARE